MISMAQLNLLQSRTDIAHVLLQSASKPEVDQAPVPAVIEELLQEFSELFKEPSRLPPHREFDHIIELIPGAQPVNRRPYRYSPAQKDEIERQVSEMLRQGIIQLSRSPFSSPVLLV